MLDAGRLGGLSRALAEPAAPGPDAARARAARRAQGAYFTPAPLVELVVDTTLRPVVERARWRRDGSPAVRVLDPAAGDGRFLAAAEAWLAARAAERGADPARAAASIRRRCLLGVERDPEFAARAAALLGAGAVRVADALRAAPPEVDGVDAVIGNPPYLRSIHLERADPELWRALRGRYEATAHGEWDLYAAFIEQSFRWLAPGGQLGLVVPSRWLTAAFAARLRALLGREAAVRGVIDFGAQQVFAGATTYASVVFLSRAPAARVFVARWTGAAWSTGHVPASELSGAPWRLSVGGRRRAVRTLAARAPALGDVARIAKGTGTNADRVFLLEHAERRGRRVIALSRELGRRVELEAAAVVPCVRGRDVRAYGEVSPATVCVVPYDRDHRLLAPDELRRRWPLAHAYLHACRARLEARERGRFAGEAFYQFGRPQNLAFLRDRAAKIIVPDVAREGRAMLDATGALVLDSAYAIRLAPGAPDGVDAQRVLDLLNSPVVAWWLRETGIPLRGGYVRMKTAYLRSLPVVDPQSYDAVSCTPEYAE